jgi:hypothetical protein
MKNQVRAEIYIDRGEAETNKSIFDRLHAEKDAIEAEFGEKLTWERLDDKQASRIAIYREGSIQDTSEALEKIRERAIKSLLQLKKVFGKRLAKLV